jgi:two-component system, LytTR family, sensor kinase
MVLPVRCARHFPSAAFSSFKGFMPTLAIAQSRRNHRDDWEPGERAAAFSALISGALVAYLLFRFVRRLSWARPFRVRFILLNLAAPLALGLLWYGLTIVIESLFTGSLLATRTARRVHLFEFPVYALLMHAVVMAVAYTMERRARAAHARAEAARAQLAALRAQLHPHFLFNALHTVVQLIHIDPARAVHAAELVASLLRATVEEERDVVTLDDEWGFVSRYLEVERIRFGERLIVHSEIDPELLDERVPSFALQALVENAVRHGAARRVAPTEIFITATGTERDLTLSVRNTGDPLPPALTGKGTGLSRLRERLSLLYGDSARLTWGALEQGGFDAVITVPRGGSRS